MVGVEQPFGQNHQAMFIGQNHQAVLIGQNHQAMFIGQNHQAVLIGQNHQAVQSMGRSMVWTFQDNLGDGLFSVSHPQAAEGATPHLCKQERRRLS